MKNRLLVLLAILLTSLLGFSQTSIIPSVSNDTASYPYWIEMMQDPSVNFFDVVRAFDRYWEGRKRTRGDGWKVFKRWEYMMQSRVLPDGTRPNPAATMEAYNNFVDNTESASGNWSSLGPSQIPAPGPPGYLGLGRLNVVAFHPTDTTKLYVGSPSGGFWQTSNTGMNWTTTTDALATLGVSSIVVDYSNPTTILIGTGDRDAGDAPGLGIFISTDAGDTWTQSNSGMGNKTVGKIIQHPTTSPIFLAATSGGIYRSVDGGSTWTQSISGNFKDICFKPTDPSIVYAAKGADFFRSTNNGSSFTQITSGLTSGQRGSIAVTPANPDYVYFVQSNSSSGFKGLYRSTNSGVSFSTRSTGPNILDWSCNGSGSGGQGWYDLAIAADPNNAEILYVGGINVWKSTDGGSSWSINSHWYGGCNVEEVHADCHYLAFSPVNGTLWACNDGGIYFASSGGASWTDRTVTMTIGQIYKLGQSQTVKEKVINGFQDNGTYLYNMTGWEQSGGGDGMECAIDYTDAGFTYHTLYYGDIYRKYNNVNQLHIAGNGTFGITESGAWITPFLLSVSDPKMMFVGYKNVWRSNDVRNTNTPVWTKISNNLGGSNSNNIAVLEQSPADSAILYVAKYGNMLFRTDNCMSTSPTYINLTASLPATGTPSDLEAHPTDPNTVYMTLGNHVYISGNKGNSWTNISGSLPNIHVNTVVCYSRMTDAIYVGTDAGVYYQDTTTNGWILYNTGLPASAEITELEIYYDADSVSNDAIRASTYGRGLWSSDIYGVYDADFEADSTIICATGSVDFTDLSSGYPTSWSWSFPGGTPSASSLQNPPNIVYSTPGIYDVTLTTGWNGYQVGTTKSGYITVNDDPDTPEQPSGDTALCLNEPNTPYTTLSVSGANDYNWLLTPDTAGVLVPNDTSVIVDWSDTWTGIANLSVQAVGNCGNSAYSPVLPIEVSPLPAQPMAPSGPTPLCQGTQITEYTTSAALNATSYTWLLEPSSAGTISGSGTTGTVEWDSLYTGISQISVQGVNNCGLSNWSDPFEVAVNPNPIVELGNDTIITWFDTLILNAGNPGALFLWSTGDTTQNIRVYYTGDSIVNYWVQVTMNNCTGNDDIGITFTPSVWVSDPGEKPAFRIIPNPNKGSFTLHIASADAVSGWVEIRTLQGSLLYRETLNIHPEKKYYPIMLEETTTGVVLVRIILPGSEMIQKMVLQPQ